MKPRTQIAWVALVTLALVGSVEGRQLPDTTRIAVAVAPPATRWANHAVTADAWNTTVAVTATLPFGSTHDTPGFGGTAWLLADVTRRAVQDALADATAEVSVSVTRSQTVFTLLVSRDDWERALARLEAELFGPAFSAEGLEESRRELLADFSFESGLPVREFETALYDMITSGTASWASDPRGSSESVAAVGTGLLDAARDRWVQSQAVLSISGAVDRAAVTAVAGPGPLGQRDSGDVASPVRLEPAWQTGERRRLEREVTSGWIAAAYPLSGAIDLTALEYLLHRVRSELVTDPPAPGLFSASVELEPVTDGRTVVLIRAAVLPESLDAWENRIRDTVTRVLAERHPPEFFRAYRRRFRSVRLLGDASPETQSLRAALDLQWTGQVRDLAAAVWNLDQARVAAATEAFGEPRVLVLGPA